MYTYIEREREHTQRRRRSSAHGHERTESIVAIFYPFSLFCEIDVSLLSLQTQPNTAPNLFQRGVEYGKYGEREREKDGHLLFISCLQLLQPLFMKFALKRRRCLRVFGLHRERGRD